MDIKLWSLEHGPWQNASDLPKVVRLKLHVAVNIEDLSEVHKLIYSLFDKNIEIKEKEGD